jgi:hypothetical protein
VNAIFVPSGDQAGNSSMKSPSAPSVRFTGLEPSAFMTKMSWLPSRLLEKAIFVPSGDHAASSSRNALFVRFVGFDPSAPTTKSSRSLIPPWYLVKATFVPSGDQAGRKLPVGEIVFVMQVGFAPSASMTKI